MARKDVVFGVKTDTGNSVNEVKKLSKSMDDLNKSAKDTKSTMSDSSGMDKFEQDLKDLDALIDSGTLDITQMTKAVKDYQTIAFRAGANSPVGAQAIKQASDLTDKIGDLNTRVKQGSNDYAGMQAAIQGANVAMAGFTGFKSATALLGDENEALMETMVQLQGAMGVMNSLSVIQQGLNKDSALMQQLQNIKLKINNKETKAQIVLGKLRNLVTGKGTKAMKLLRGALISTGIGALVVGLGLLIANFSKVSKWVKDGIKNFKDMGIGVKILLYPITLLIAAFDAVQYALQSLGIIDSEETKKRLANAEERVKASEEEAKAVGERYDFEIAKAKAAGKDTVKLEEEKRAAFRQTTFQQIKDIVRLAILNKEYTDEQRKQVADLTAEIKKSSQDSTLAQIANNKKVNDEAKKNSTKRIADAKAEQEALNKILMDQASVEDELYKMRLSANDLEEQAVAEKYDALFAKAQGNAELEKQLLIQQERELGVLRKGFSDKEAEDKATAIATSNALRHSLMRESNEEDLALLQEKYDAERLALLEDKILTAEEKIPLQNEILEREKAEADAINQKWDAKELADAKIVTDKKKALQKGLMDVSVSGLNALSDLNSLVTDLALKKAKGNVVEEEKIRKASFNRNKALQLGIATIQGVQAVLAAYSSGLATPVIGPATGAAYAAIAGVGAAVSIAKIAASKYEGGGGGGGTVKMPSAPSAGASASSFAISDNTSSAQTELNADGTQSGGSGQTQVVVVETDITTAVNNVAQINEIATF